MLLYVLTEITAKGQTGGEPVGVTDKEEVANKWLNEGRKHNWIPLELNDITGLGDFTSFKPKPGTPAAFEEKKRQEQEQTITQLKQLVERLTAANNNLLKFLKREGYQVPEPVKTGSLLKTAAELAAEERELRDGD